MGNKFRNKLARFFYGRYGADSLYNALFVAELVLLFISTVFSVLGRIKFAFAVVSIVLYALTFAIIVWSMFRFFSRNIQARRRENDAFLRFKGKFKKKPKPHLPADTAEHIFRACPHCRSVLRLPKTPGKHGVKCPRCGGRFRVKVQK